MNYPDIMNSALSIPEAAGRLSVHPKTVYNLIQRGELRAVKVGRLWRIPEPFLNEYLGLASSRAAGVDDEPLSAEDMKAIRRGLRDIKAGRTISLGELERKYGL